MPPRAVPPAPTISASEFKATCLELMDHIAQTGAELVVTKRGRPMVRISTATTAPASAWGFMAGTIVRHGDIVAADPESWAATATDPLQRIPRR